jgi:hypothetical protein
MSTNADNSEERVHHPYSPSQLQSLEACPCYKGKDSKHERTIAGTLGHKVVETKMDDDRLSDADAVAAAACIDFVETRKLDIQTRFPGGPVIELQESYLSIDDLVFDDAKSTTAGYVDTVLLSWDKTYAEMADWKFGMWAVEDASNNLQAGSYMLGLFKRYPKLQRIRFFFRQPHIDGFSETEMTRDRIPEMYLRIQTVVARARTARKSGNYDSATPGCPLCCFCANLGECPKVAALMLNVGRKFHSVAVPPDITPTALLSSKDTGMCMKIAQIAKTWAEAFRARQTDRVLRGDSDLPEGFHIESRRGNRKVADVVKFAQITLNYIKKEVYDKLVEPPPIGAIEEVISEAAPRGSKESTVRQYAADLEAAGAVAHGEPYSFLKASNDKEKKKAAKQQALINETP